MGCDGGTIPKRHELVKKKEKKEAKDKQADTAAKWRYCSVSSNKLVAPIVSCELGRLYNKDSVLEYLLNKDCANSTMMKHIRNLKDIIELRLTRKQGYEAEQTSSKGGEANKLDSDYVCPIANLEMNGQYKFYTLKTCGCVFSERALKTIKSDVCLICNKAFTSDDLIILNGNDNEVLELEQKMVDRRNKAKEAKKNKRKVAISEELDIPENGTKRSKSVPFMNTKTSAQVLDKTHKNYSVEKDPNASEAYKSLFTSHESAKSKLKAPWVTFNPMYN